MSDSSADIVRNAADGDAQARQALLEHHLASLNGYVTARLGRALRARETSQDIVQSVVREAIEDLPQFEYRGSGSFRDWLFHRAENKIRDRARFWRRDKRSADREVRVDAASLARKLPEQAAQVASLFTPSRHAVAKEELARVEAAFLELPGDYREVIVLARLQGLSHHEVARRMGRTPIATRTLLSRALARLATALEG